MVQQGPPPRPGRVSPGRPRRDWSDDDYADDGEYPPWAVPGTVPRRADHDERERRRLRGAPGTGQAEAERRGRRPAPGPGEPGEPAGPGRPGRSARGRATARARRGRRALYIWGGALVAVLLIVGGVGYELLHRPSPPPAPANLAP